MSFTNRGITWVAAIAVLFGAASVSATVHIVNQVGTTFSPRDITIVLGDTVQWVSVQQYPYRDRGHVRWFV